MARILVVENERIVARDIQRCLVRHGHEVPVLAESVDDAVEAAEQVRPDLALRDVTLRLARRLPPDLFVLQADP